MTKVVLTLLGFLCMASSAFATVNLDFNIDANHCLGNPCVSTNPVISYAGGAAPLVGSNIQVDNVFATSTPLNSGQTRNCINCIFSFTTGPATGSWSWGPVGTISLVGGIDLNNNGILDAGDVPANTTIFSGQFGFAVVQSIPGVFNIIGAGFVDQKNTILTNYFGLPNGPNIFYAGGFNLSFTAPAAAGQAFTSSSVLSGDIANTIPEPSTVVLMGTCLLGVAALLRRRFAA
ncbi:MAG: PEP-CTERM sorting domain-containing protein [Acidobacteria bacterium]|nr:PEP-CTERM sorting domain-containing protein [Acidobacteriota bacterium]